MNWKPGTDKGGVEQPRDEHVNRKCHSPSQSNLFCKQHVPDAKYYSLSKNVCSPPICIVFLLGMGFYFITSFCSWKYKLSYFFSCPCLFSLDFPPSQVYEYQKRNHSLKFLWSLLVMCCWWEIYCKLAELWMSCWKFSHIRFSGGCVKKQPCVFSPGAVQQNPIGQHHESVLRPSLLCFAKQNGSALVEKNQQTWAILNFIISLWCLYVWRIKPFQREYPFC